MKTAFALFSIVILTYALVGCATTASDPSKPSIDSTIESGLPYVRGAATVATGAVLNFAVKNSAQTTLANQIWGSANGVDSLATGAIPTPALLQSTILAFGGSQQTASYASYASAVSAIYTPFYQQLITGNVRAKTIVDLLEAIAAGARDGAQAYQTLQPSV